MGSDYQQLAEKYKADLEATQEELHEFRTQSAELEKELDLSLEQEIRRTKELQTKLYRVTTERDHLKLRATSTGDDSRKTMQRLEEQLSRMTAEREECHRNVRQLEQTNDDLERGNREVTARLVDYKTRLEAILEKNSLLETELEDADEMKTHVHRLRDETRDLKQELAVRELKTVAVAPPSTSSPRPSATIPPFSSSHARRGTSSSSEPMEHDGGTDGLPRSYTFDQPSSHPRRTPASRISALTIVGDLLRKVGALESKLGSVGRRGASSVDKEGGGGPSPKHAHLDDGHT